MKVDGPKVSNMTVQKYESGRSKDIKLDGPRVSKWTSQKHQFENLPDALMRPSRSDIFQIITKPSSPPVKSKVSS